MKFTIGFFLLLVMSACTMLEPLKIDPSPQDFPSQFSLYSETADHYSGWWKDFQSQELDLLMADSLAENFTVLEVRARLEQARYGALKAGAYYYPEVGFSGSGSQQEMKVKGQSKISDDEWSLGLNAAYEVDLWGRVRAFKRSETEKYAASREDLKTALLSVSGAVAENWIELIGNRRHQDLLLEQLELQQELLKLIIARFPLAKSTALDIYQQQQIVEKMRTELIPTVRNQEVIKRRLALLAGRSNLFEGRFAARSFPELSPLPNLGLPADLLAARPDVRAAGLRLQAGEWEIVAARAERLPALRLSAAGNYFDDDLSSLFDNWILNLAANLASPIFDGGRRRAEVGRVRAVVDERLALYRETVINAVFEVEDALTREQQSAATLASIRKQLELSRQSLREARRRYLNGSSDFLNVLNEELNSLQLEHDIITQEKQLLLARIALYKALGGSWLDDFSKEGLEHGKS